jgi:protein SFI1
MRTSTPVQQTYRRGGRAHTSEIPSHSVFDTSEVIDGDDDNSKHGDGLSTPKAPVRRLISVDEEDVGDDEDENEAEEDEQAKRKAEKFYETGLKGRCWDVWVQSAKWIRVI